MPDKKIYVYIPGTTQPTVLSPEDYEAKKDKLFTKYADAQVVEMEGYKNGDDVGESDFFVNIPGSTMPTQISAKDFAAKKDKIYAAYPDVQVSRIKPVNYWGDKLTEIYDRIGVLNNELQGLPAETEGTELRNMDDEDLIADAQRIAKEKPGLGRRREIQRELGQLFSMRESNPAWQKYWANTNADIDNDYQRIEQLQAELKKNNPEAEKHYRNAQRFGMMGGASAGFAAAEAAQSDPEYNSAMESFAAARLMLDDAKKAASAPSRYGGDDKGAGSDFWKGVVDGAPEALSIASLMRAGLNMHLVDAIKKIQKNEADGTKTNIQELVKQEGFDSINYLNAGEKELVKAFVKKAEVEAGRSDNVGGKTVSQISRSYQSGQSAIQSVGFMADFALMGGIGEKAAEATVGGLVKAAGRNELAKLGAETLYGTVKALAMTPLMPSSYSSFVNNILQMDNAGAVDLSGKRMLQAAGDVIIENISETVGSKPLELIGLPLQKVKFPSWAGALRNAPIMRAFKQAGYNGFFEEMVEEWTGNALRVMTGVDKDALKDFATVDQQLVTAGAFAPMSLFGLPLSMMQYHAASKDMRNKGVALETILHNLEATKNIRLNVEDKETPEELGNYMSSIYRSIVENGGDAAEAYKAVMEYTEAVGRYKMLDGAFEQQKDIERSRRTAEIDNQIGDSTWYHEGKNGNNYVRVITDADGNERFVVAEQDGSMAVVDRNGNRSFISEQELADGIANGQLTDSGEQYLFDFLDKQTETQRESNERERMTAERQQANVQLIQQAQPGMQVNLGTVETPEMATILGVDAGNYIVQKADGTTAPFTPQEMAEKLGINTTPKTDAQIEEEQAALVEKRDKNREFANRNYKGKPITWNGQQYTIVGVTRGHDSINTDGTAKEWAYDVHVTDANGQSRTIGMTDQEFDGLLETLFNDALQSAENGEPVPAPVQEETPAAPVEDNTPRDFRGDALPMRTNKRTGQQVVDENALWNKDPEAWARWNDNNPNQRVTSKERLEDQIKDLDKQIEKDTKAVHNAALKGIDADKMDDMEADLAQKIERRNLLSSILDRYNMPAAAGPTIAGEQRKAAAEQTIAQQQAGFPGIQQKWNNAPKVVGAADEIRLANGETISGHYVLTEATAPTPSHDPANGFAMTEGFPVDENGKTVNDRDYQHDQAAQASVLDKAANYDQRALQTPVIVSNDGVVLSGNDRTMASQIAAANNTDGAYTEYLAKYPQKYGFTAEQVGQFQHPRVVFVPDAAMPYNAATFAKFNAEDKKSQSKTEKAVKAGKTLTPETLGTLSSLIDRYDDINALYNDADGVNELLDILLAAEVITPEQIAALKDGERLSGTGMDLLESTLIGAALDEEAVRIAMEDANIRKSVVSAIAQIIVGNTLSEYNLRAELTDAIQLVANGKRAKEIKFGESVQSYIRQQHLFEEDVVAEATVQMLADAINDRKPSFLKKVLSLYNRDAVDSASGQLNLLTGDVLTREAILRNILEYLGYDTKIIFDTSEREAEQRAAAAEQPAGPAAEAGPAQQNDAPVQSDAGSTVTQFNREEVAAILEQGNVGETGLAEIMTDDEIAEFMRLWDAFLPYNDALGEAYNRLSNDLRATAPKKTREAAQAEIDRLEQAQNEAFAPLQEYVDSLLEKYDLSEQSADVAPVVEDAVADEVAEEMEDEFEDEVEDETEDETEEPDPDEPKPTKGKKGSKKSSKKAEDRLANSKFEKREGSPILHIKGGATNAQIDKQTYTQEEYEEFIYGHSMFSTYVSKKTGEKIEIVYVDDQNPIYNNHQVMFWRWEPDAEYGDRWESGCTTDCILKYLKANKFKCIDKKENSSRKNKHGFWMNRHGYCTNPIRVKLPSVRKGWQNFSETTYYQDDSGKWYAGGSASYGTGGGTLGVKRGPYDTKSAAIRATIEALERFRKANPGNNYDLRDVDNLIRTLKTKTLPQAMMEEGALNNVPRAEITASELDNGVQGLLFGEEGQTAAPAAAEEKPKRKRTSKKKAETPAASVEETPVEDSEEETEPKFVLEDEEGTPGNFHWASERVCTNPIIIAVPGLDKRSSVSKIALAEKDGKWYVASYVVEDSGNGTSWGTEIPSFKSNYIPYSSRYAAVKAGIDGIRWLLENMAPKYSNQFGYTWNNTKDLVDYLVRTELPATQKQDNRIETITEGLKAFDAAKGRGKFGKAFTNLMKSVGEMLGFADDELNGKLKYAADKFRTEQVSDSVDRAKAQYVRRVRAALKEETGNTSMFGYDADNAAAPAQKTATVQSEAPTAPAYGSQNKLVTTDQYEELKKKMLAKLNSQLNAGFDPEILAWGAQMAMYHVEAGARKFIDFSQRMIRDLGEGIRPYLQAIYNGARYMPGMEELRNDMDSAADVEAINVDTITIEEPAAAEQTTVPAESTELPEVEKAGWETRPNTEIQGFDGLDSYSVYNACEEYIDRIIGETGLNFAQVDMIAIGSRAFGTAREDSDLDILVEYEGDVKEDAVFNALNAEPLELMGIKVDFFPIRAQESGTLVTWLESHDNGRPVAKEQPKEESSNPVVREVNVEGLLGAVSDMYQGKRGEVKLSDFAEDIQQAREETDTNPTDAQKKAGNYAHGHLTLDGYDISIENPKGSVRSGKDANGNEWQVTMNNDYGYIRMTEGVDGDHIDIFLSDNPTQGNVFVVDQVNPDTGEFDEHKVMYGFHDAQAAREAYLANYSPGWKGLGRLTEVSKDEFKRWVNSSHRKTKPFSEYSSVKTEGDVLVENATPIERYARENFTKISDLTKAETDKAISIFDALWNTNGEYEGETDGLRRYVADEYGVSQDYQNFLRTWDNHLVFISNGNLYQLDLDFAPAGGRSHLVARRYYVRDRQAEENTQELIRRGAPFQTEEAQPSETSGQLTVGELGKYTHTKTGKEMSIVRLTGDRLSAGEFKRLKARAKEFGGYYSSYGSAKGFLFDTEEDAIKFNNINTSTNVNDNTDRKTASDTAIISSEAASVASKAESLAESAEPAEPAAVNRAIQRIDDTLDKIDDQLALLGYYEADQTGPFHESYGYMKSAEKKAVKDADRLAKKLAADLGIDVGRKTLAKANIAPAGGDISFRLPLNEGREIYVTIELSPKLRDERIGGDYLDDLYVGGVMGQQMAIMFRLENSNASGQARYEGSNNFAPYNVSYADLLRRIRSAARNYLPEAPADTTPVSGPVDILQVAKEQAEKNRKSGKKSVSSQEDGDAMLGGLFDTLYEAEDNEPEVDETPAPAERVKPTEVNGFTKGEKVIYIPDQGKRKGQEQEATIYDFEYDGRPVLDAGLAPVLYEVVNWEQIRKIENEPVNDTNDGLQRIDEQRAEGTPADGSGQQQGLQRGAGEESEVPGQESERTDRGGEGGREGDVHGRSRTLRPRYDDSVKRNTRNYRRAKGDEVPKTVAARYKANIAAIRLLKDLQDSGKQATKEQMAVLRQYTGWGGLGGYFNNEYSPEYREMRSLLTDEEMQAAALSINTAYYTPTEIIDSMWDIAKRLGFEGGNVLEGSAGIGNILASMPKSISERSAITAVELDNITGGILQQLYPDANVQIKGFQEVDIPNGSIDLAITNVPFGDINVYDSKEKDLTRKFGGKIHDFCIAKNIRKLAEGGIGIFISTRGTLDGSSKALRQWIVNEGGADVIGAFRLNNATFEGTKATSDIIVVRKRVNGQVSPNAINVTDTEITRRVDYQTNDTEWNKNTRSWEPITGKAAMELNSYFVEHPENMGGEMGFGFEHNDTYRPGSSALWPTDKIDQNKRLAKWAKQFSSMQEEVAPTVSESESVAEDTSATKEGQLITNSKGEICISRSGKAVPIAVNAQKVKGYSKAQVLADYDALKTAINEVLDYQLNNESDEGLKPLLDKLNKAYDRFAKRYDRLNRNTAISFLRNDVDFPSIAAVEDYREKKGIDGKVKIEVKKTSIFSGRVLGAKRIPTPSNAKDGVIVSINQFGHIDIPFIAKALNKDEETVRKEILASGLGFENPLTGNVDVEYEYLSGNVREKLEYARSHNTEGQYDKNIEALEKVIPADIPAHLIEFSLGSDWMPVELYTEYAKEKFGVNDNFVPTMVGGSWILPENTWEMGVNTEKNRAAGVHSEKLRTDKMGHELMIAAMNNTSVVFSRSYKDPATGETITEHDKEATQAATTKMSEMRDDFKEWCKAKMLDTPELAERIAKIYNDTFNAIVPKEIRDTFIPEHFDGMATKLNNGKPLNLRQHQAKAVIRATTEPLMMAHEVGTGKTFTLIATAMEMRRLGTAKKPMIVVQNATLGQFVSSAKELYPNAKILTISESDRTVEGRSAFYAKIKYNDWDMIVVPQSVFEMIPDSEERQRAFIQEKIDEKKFILEQVKQAKNSTAERQLKKELEDLEYEYQYGEKPPKKGKGGKKDAKKEAEAVENAVAKAKKQLDRRTDDVSDFDDMGIDALLIDEAHSYKHLGFSTAMQRGVKGVDATGSKKSAGVYLKTRAVFDKVGWKNVVFATGTPISNTAAEIWTFMKYLMPADVMRQHHIYYFDDFVRNFGNISQSLEFTTSGKFKETTRFASYTNLPELIRIWSSVTDTVRSKDAVAEGDEKLEDKQPKMEGGQARDIYLQQSLSLVDIMNAVRAKLEWYENLSGKEKKENSHIPLTMFGIAKMAAIDPRLVDKNAQDEPNSKTNKAVEETLKALKDSEQYKGTAALFCDNFRRWDYNDAGKRVEGFNIFEEIKRKLVAAGVPEGQIVIMKSGMTTAAKEKIFARVNSGEVRVIMGTTATLGTGVNIQERLFFEAHLDAPNRPMDYTQRNGRILRQGNLHKEWGIPVRVVRFGVEDSLDVTAYQRLSTKAKFIDSIMDGKPLLANGMENRVLEEEDEGEFDNPVAVLSGSQYALLKSQAERELRKLRNKKEQHRQDQIYIERTLKENKNRIAYDEKLIKEANANLAKVKAAFPDGAVKEVTIEGRKAKGAEQIAEAIKDNITTPLRSRLDSRRVERGFTNETLNYTMTFDGVPVNIKVDVERMNEYDDKRHEYRPVMRTRVEYSVPRFGIEGRFVQGGYTSIKDIVPDFMGKIATGRYFEDAVNNLTNTVNRLNSDNELMLQRRGKPFADEDKLTEQEKIVADYTEKMRAELAEKEAKYAEMAKNATTSFNLDSVEVDEDDDGEGETSAEYSDMDGNGIFSGIEDRKDGEDAMTFTGRVVKAVTDKYPFLKGKIITLAAPERNADKLPNGRYNYKLKKIVIFAKDNRSSADGVERTILHEAIHLLIHDFGWNKNRHFINLFNTSLVASGYYSLEEYRDIFADVKATYEEKGNRKYTDAEIREEMVTFELSLFLQSGIAGEFIAGAKEFMPELGEQLEKLVNTLGYEPTTESESRMDAEVLQEYREQRIIAAQQRNAERRSVGNSGSESVSGDGTTTGERGGEGGLQGNEGEGPALDENGVSYELVTDPETIQRLERGDKGTGYRNVVQNADGSLGSPMAGKLGRRGERSRATSPFFLNQWEQAEENPDMATEDGKINLIKPQGRGNVDGVDYNPYIHIRPTTLNRQFTQAWRRPELVYVETAYPASELESGYKADKAKLSVGRHPWNGGDLILSRYDKPTRIVPWAEVAEEWVREYQGTGVTFDIVPPGLLPELASRGVEILPPKKAAGKPAMDAYNKWRSGVRNRVAYHGSIADFDAFDINHAGEGEGFQSHGFGHYIALDRNTGVGYAWSNAFDKADKEGKIEPEIAEILRNDSFDDYDSMVKRYDELLAKRKEDVAKELAAERAEKTPDMAIVRTLQTEQENLQRYSSLQEIFEGTRNVYTVEIPDDTGDNYIDEMKTLAKSGRRRIAEVVRNQDASLLQTAKFGPNWLPNGLETLANVIEREQLAGLDLRRRLSAAFGSEKEASRIMHEAGFAGIKYDGRSDGPCVVIFSNEDIRIVGHERFRVAEGVEGFLSNAEEAVRGITQEKATPQQWLKMIESRGGLKAGEDKWVGLSDWLKASDKKTLTKQEVLDYINENKIQIEETTYAEEVDIEDWFQKDVQERIANGKTLDELQDEIDALADSPQRYDAIGEDDVDLDDYLMTAMKDTYGDDFERGYIIEDGEINFNYDPYSIDTADYNEITDGDRVANSTRIAYTTEGLSNKREIALSVPTIEPWNTGDDIHFGDAGKGRAIAWARFGDAVIGMNGKALFIDEIQSKRHQEGRERGYQEKSSAQLNREWAEAINRYKLLSDEAMDPDRPKPATEQEWEKVREARREMDAARDAYNNNARAIPAAPFEKNWHELAMKRMLRLAAEEGYDYMVWTTGEQQAQRYDIGRVVTSIEREEDNNFNLWIRSDYVLGVKVDDNGIITRAEGEFESSEGQPLSELVGKDLAVKMMAMKDGEEIEPGNVLAGAQGMKGFYDEILPRFMNKYAKKWGVQVEDKTLYDLGDGPLKVHAIRITPEMKESVMKGQLMFREGTESVPSPASYTESMGARRLSASETARKCGIEIEFRPSSQMQFNGKPLAGRWINGKMYICLEHCRDAADAVRTVLHEGVGHNGLRRLIGDENMTAFCLDMFRRLHIDARREIAGAAVTKYGGNVAESVEEYLAERAEVMDFENEDYERNFWDIVLDGLRRVLAKVGIDIPLSQRDVRWLMWQSYNANKQTDVLNEAKRQVVARKLGFTLRQLSDEGQAVQIARNKIAEEELAPAARIYNKDVVYWLNRLHETWVDKDNAVHSLVSAIEKATKKAAAAFEDIRLALNQQSSKGLAAIEKWERENWVPMQDAIKALMKEKGCDLKDIERYVMIKHGLERNEVFAKRDAKAYYQDLRDSAVKVIDKALEDGKLDQTLHDTLVAKEDAKLDKHVKAVDAGTDVKYKELRKQDYGGLTAMYSEWDAYEPFQEGIESEEEYKARVLQARHPKYTYIDAKGREQVDMAATEDAAMKEVEEFEKGSEKAVEELWKRINNATKATLKHQYDANMLSRQQYLQVSAMFKYYVPLRGFAEDTAEDLYEYYRSDQRGDFEPPLLKAKGRKTEAESPFGYIGSMASSGIAADMKNETKLALYYFVSNRSANDLVTISEVWYEKTGTDENGKSIFSPVYPPFKEDLSGADAKQAYENWENEMKEKAKAGLAFKGTRKLNLHNSVIHIDKNQKDSHIIKFKVGGRDMMMYINGNPRAAQAINNELNVEMSTDYQKVFGKVLRWFSGINTSYNPEFWLSNAQRDALFALMSVDVKEDSEYGKAFRKNFGRLLRDTLTPGKKGGAYSLKRKLDKGELGDERLDKLYKEFVENGGVTGYTTLKNNEEWELELRKYTGQEKQAVAAVKNAFEAVQHFGEAIEQMTRFAAYITSREQGKEIKDAVNDAKELTVNFNRKGSGQAISFKEAAKLRTKNGHPLNPVQKAFVVGASWLPVYGRRFIMFFNASVQGLNAMYKLFKKDKGRMGTWAAAYLALGVIQAVIHGMLDDDDDYLDIPDYERRNNLLLGGKGVYFKWALPQEARVFYGIGDMAVNHIMGRTPNKSIIREALESASDIAPLNPAGGLSALAPSAIVPIVEVALNRDYKGSKIYNDMRYLSDEEKKRTPKYTMAYQGTGKPYILLSQFANWLSGGDYADAGWLNINPASVEHILQGATGGAGTTIGKLYRGTVGQVLGEDFAVRNTPFLSRLLTVTDDRYRNAHTTELFDYYKAEAEHTKKLINTYIKNDDDKKLDKLYDSEDYEIMQIYEFYKGMMKYYNEELKYTTDKKERKALMREQDALRKEMIQEISSIGSE